MPRDSRRASRRVRVQSTDRKAGLRPVAPLVVSAQSNAGLAAQGLSEALNLAGQVYQVETERRTEEAQDDAERDFWLGSPKAPEDSSEAYQARLERLRVRRQVSQDKIEWEEVRAQIDLDGDDPTAAVDAAFQAFWGGKYGGLEGPGADEVTPLLDELYEAEMNRTLLATREGVKTQAMQDAAGLISEFQSEEGFNHQGFFDAIKTIPFIDRSDVWQTYVMALSTVAVEQLDPSLLDVPSDIAGAGLPLQYREPLAQLRSRLDTQLKTEERAANAIRNAEVYTGLSSKALTGVLATSDLEGPYDRGEITAGEVKSLMTMQLRTLLAGRTDSQHLGVIQAGLGETLSAQDSRDAMDLFASAVAKAPNMSDSEKNTLLLSAIAANQAIPQSDATLMSNVAPESPQEFLAAFNMYKAYSSVAPGAIGRDVTKRAVLQFDAYDFLTKYVGPEQALTTIREYDPERTNVALGSTPVMLTMREQLARTLDKTDTRGFLFWKEKALDNPANMEVLREPFGFLMGLGSFTPEQAADLAIEYVKKTHVFVDGNVYPLSSGWPSGEAQEAADWYRETFFPEEADDLLFANGFGREGEVYLYHVEDLAPQLGERINIERLAHQYRVSQRHDQADAGAVAAEERFKELRGKAKTRIIGRKPVGVRHPAQLIAWREKNAWWDELAEDEKEVMLRTEVEKLAEEIERKTRGVSPDQLSTPNAL